VRMARDKRLTLEQSKRISRARVIGAGRDLTIGLEDYELSKLMAVIASDNGQRQLEAILPALPAGTDNDYYKIPIGWFSESVPITDFVGLFLRCAREVEDFGTYFDCLCELHKRRRKYAMILAQQPLPTMVQVSPKALLEFGGINSRALASWLTWRKWIFDIDNRAAQETGYLFEPILASALGGQSYSANTSPIRRANNPKKGRQVDCIVDKNAYEFKLRVTIAASGQGRFAEELEFARDCRSSKFNPVLLVLDPTPSTRLQDLQSAFERSGGQAYIGNEAWSHLEEEAGPTMATFIEKYVRRPIADVDKFGRELLDFFACAAPDRRSIKIRLSNDDIKHEWTIIRKENPALSNNSKKDESE